GPGGNRRHARAPAPRPERLEREEPVHRVGGRRALAEGRAGGPPRRGADGRGRAAARRRAHLVAAPGHQHREHRARRGRPRLDPRAARLAAERAPLRGPPGQGQEADDGGVRRGAVPDLASLLRHPTAAHRPRRRVRPDRRPALRRPRRRDAAHRVPRRRPRADAAVLAGVDRPGPALGADRARRRPRQLAARAGQAPRRRRRGDDPRAEHPHRHPAALRPREHRRRRPAAHQSGRHLPRPRRRAGRDRGRGEPGSL
ncbi:MAG: Phosphoglycerate mutase, partial [uncultured Actinomycetospora sp.]